MYFPLDLTSFWEFAAAWPMVLFDASIKGLLLLAMAGLLLRSLRNIPAAGRHWICVPTMAGLIALPLLSVALPALHVPIFSASSATDDGDLRRNRDPVPASPQNSTNEAHFPNSRADDETPRTVSPIPQDRFSETSFRPHSADTWSRWICAIWFLGTSLVLAQLAGGMIAAGRLIRAGRSLEGNQSAAILRDISRQLGLRRRVRLIASNNIAMPMTAGVIRPTILLPACDDWPSGQLRLVLTHELAHVARRDCLTDRLMQLGCALYWFNPLAWLLARAARLERERACDDLVLTLGAKPSDYADVLLNFARPGNRSALPRAALGMASSLEKRLAMILDSTTKRRPLRRRTVLAGAVILVLVVVPLAVLRPSARGGEEPDNSSEKKASEAQGPVDEIQAEEKVFGPVIERFLKEDHDYLIDLDTGKLSELPEEIGKLNTPAKWWEWARRQGIDAIREEGEGLYGFAMIAKPIRGSIAENFADGLPGARTIDELKTLDEIGDPGTPIAMLDMGWDGPPTFLFITGDGGKGVLQIVEFVNEPHGGPPVGVKIRYRLLKEEG